MADTVSTNFAAPLGRSRICVGDPHEGDDMSDTAGTDEATGDAESDLTITEWEVQEVEKANATGKQPVVFVHGLWLLPNSWDPWREVFEEAGYVTAAPGWPDDPETTEEAHEHPEVFAKKSVGEVADHYEEVIRALDRKPAIVGHSFGGLLTEILAGRGLAVASVPISPAPFRGVLPLPYAALRTASVALRNPANRNRAVPLTYDQFKYSFANMLDEDEAKELYEKYSVAGPGQGALPGREREPEPVDRGQGRHEEPRARPDADPRGGEGPHGSARDRQRVVQTREAQRGRHRGVRIRGPRPLALHRSRLARRLRQGARVRQAVRVGLRGARRSCSKDAFEDEHPPGGHQILQVIREALDP